MITGVIYTYKGVNAIKHALDHPEDEEADFLNPEIIESDEQVSTEH